MASFGLPLFRKMVKILKTYVNLNKERVRQSSLCSMVFFSLIRIKDYSYLQKTVSCEDKVEKQQLWSVEKGVD